MASFSEEIKLDIFEDFLRPYRSLSQAERNLSDDEVYDLTEEIEDYVVERVMKLSAYDLAEIACTDEAFFTEVVDYRTMGLRGPTYIKNLFTVQDAIKEGMIVTILNSI